MGSEPKSDVVVEYQRIDGVEGRTRPVTGDRCVERLERGSTLAGSLGKWARALLVEPREDDRLEQPGASDGARASELGIENDRAAQRVTDEVDRFGDLECIEDGTQVVDHARPLEAPIRRHRGVAVSAQVERQTASNVVEVLGDPAVAVAVEPGGVHKDQWWPVTAEVVERHRDLVAGRDVPRSTLPDHESVAGSGYTPRRRPRSRPGPREISRRAMRVTL